MTVRLSLLLLAVSVPSMSAQVGGWDTLRTLQRRYTLPFYLIDGSCYNGQIVKFTPHDVTIVGNDWLNNRSTPYTRTILPTDLIAVGSGHDIIFSNRSSWRDVQKAMPGHAERLEVTTLTGKKFKIVNAIVNESGLEFTGGGDKVTLLKKDIASVDYVTQRPASDGTLYFFQEMPLFEVFDPDVWIRAAGVSTKLRVRIYDSTKTEDDTDLGACRPKTEPLLVKP